ncbi:MAG: 50S ribosomal protein L9 [Candidatus Moranbacteria bacterium CG_4_9_14_3_um_filter_42_9]|nr:MAG: 50S ribosomal protein L9 [Candidatus Moranbacteria bacterium CG_4_9_14_3_um_filter_42_9]
MKVILLQDIKSLGKKLDIKEVSDGYARNFLLPKKLAETATDNALKKIKEQKEKMALAEEKNLENFQKVAEILQNKEIMIRAKEKGGKLFGSILAKDIVKELGKENIEITEKAVALEKPIKATGKYKVKIILENGIQAVVNLSVAGIK